MDTGASVGVMYAATASTACFRVAQGEDALVQSLVSYPLTDTNSVVMLALPLPRATTQRKAQQAITAIYCRPFGARGQILLISLAINAYLVKCLRSETSTVLECDFKGEHWVRDKVREQARLKYAHAGMLQGIWYTKRVIYRHYYMKSSALGYHASMKRPIAPAEQMTILLDCR